MLRTNARAKVWSSMGLVGNDTTGKAGRIATSNELKAALVRWHTGRGIRADLRSKQVG